jgi:VanZ family protein
VEKIKRLFKFWGPPFVLVCLLFYSSSRPAVIVSEIYWPDFFVKKIGHMIVYGLLFLLIYRALKNSVGKSLSKPELVAYILTFLYGVSDEYHQTLTPGRQGLIRDMMINGFGAGLVWLGLWQWLPKAPKKLKNWAKKLQLI